MKTFSRKLRNISSSSGEEVGVKDGIAWILLVELPQMVSQYLHRERCDVIENVLAAPVDLSVN